MKTIRQIAMVTLLNIGNIPRRLGTSCVVVIGISAVVAVLVSTLAMVNSLRNAFLRTADAETVMVLADGANFESSSYLTRETVRTIMSMPEIARTPEGTAAVSREVITSVLLPRSDGDERAEVSVRGLSPYGLEARPELELIEGRMYGPGVRELIVGSRSYREFRGLEIGDEVQLQDSTWAVVGIFESGDMHDSSLLTDVDTLLAAYDRSSISSLSLVLDSSVSLEAFRDALAAKPGLSVEAISESQYVARASDEMSGILLVIVYIMGTVMAIGALFGTLNTMYAAVSQRQVEIATLRAIGFGRKSVVISVLFESLLLALIGALLGVGIAWAFFNGDLMSWRVGSTNSSLVFALDVGSQIRTGVIWACTVGLIGGLLPALRAARLTVASALRAA